ncbi:MAG TPA: isoprenylcysteine carboxylmethyltransferase family protein [Mycobacterium sp.]|nr:isoprenylcysteine carboxylmethyltransferase family protein [Mycobacterium sp.]
MNTRVLIIVYGTVAYLTFVAAFLYAIGFTGNIGVPRSVDHGIHAPLGEALAVNVALLGLFAVQHSVMARPGFKRWWTRFVATSVERSTYVLIASVVLFVVFWQWRTMPAAVWDMTSPIWRAAAWSAFWLGWATVLAASFMISHFELFGLRQAYLAWRGRKPNINNGFRTPLLYRLVRHPLMVGFLIAFWSAPRMTTGHLVFAIATTGYILIAVQFEERDLAASLGQPYREYRRRVPMLVPRPGFATRRGRADRAARGKGGVRAPAR